jgi:hypothetical protein
MYRRDGDPSLGNGDGPHRNDVRLAAPVAGNGKAPVEWQQKAEVFAEQLTPGRAEELAGALCLSVSTLSELPLLGFCPNGPHTSPGGPCWTFPEEDEAGHVVGLMCRYRNGDKKAWPGGKRGLTVPRHWRGREGPVFSPEGASDTLALAALGLAAVGRPSNTGGVEMLAGLLREVSAERQLIVLGEYDPKPTGAWPGRDGAAQSAAALQDRLGRSVGWALPPDGAKDVRAWAQARQLSRGEEATSDDWQVAGETFTHAVLPALNRTDPGAGRSVVPPSFPPPVPASELAPGGATAAWLWRGYLARGSITLLTSLWKAGKSTLLAHLARCMGRGEALADLTVAAGKVLIVSEESAALWAGRRDKLDIGDHALFYVRPFVGRPDPVTWLAFIQHVAGLVREYDLSLVVFDTLSALSPCDDENDAAKMLAALTPLHLITNAGAAVQLAHHPRKGDGGEGQASRGSGALPGFVDVILEMQRARPGERGNRQRELTAYSRFDDTPAELVIELHEDGSGYRSLGSPAEADRDRRLQVLGDLLPGASPGNTADELLAAWPAEVPKPGLRTLRQDLSQGAEAGRWSKTGAGRKGDPLRYWFEGNAIPAAQDSIAAGIESDGRADGERTA